MLRRKAYERLQKWKETSGHKALLIEGARQIGKTYLIREFGKRSYKHFIEINFITTPKAAQIFSGNLDADTIITNISAFTMKETVVGETLIFFDEIQECPEARTAIKFLVEDGRFDYVESGSLLGVQYKQVLSYPVGYEEHCRMYPLDFEEFLWANGVSETIIDGLRQKFEMEEPVSESVHNTMKELFQYYTVTGGMPAVVQNFVDSHDITKVVQIQKDILELYRQDISKYAIEDKMRIKDIFDRIPAELSEKNRRFKLADISKQARMNRYENSFMWLKDAGVANPCYNVTEPKLPLKLNEKRNLFKLFLADTGLLLAQSMGQLQFEILQGNLEVNMGSILENMIAQQLQSNGFELYYFDKKGVAEIDFLVQQNQNVLPIEVKSGNNYHAHPALHRVLQVEDWNIKKAYVLAPGNVEKMENITYIPWYMVMFLKKKEMEKPTIVQVDLSGLGM